MNGPAARRACPLCGQDNAAAFLQKPGLQLVRCEHCLMVYASSVSPELASGTFYDRAGVPFYLSPAKVESDYAPVRFERELRLFRRHCPKGEVLDVGCSTGAFLHQLKARYPDDYTVTGTDVSGAPLDYAASRGMPVLRGDFLQQDFSARKFDAVTFWAVMEHLVEPGRFLEQAASALKPDGLIFILVPNLKSLAVRLLGAKYRYIFPPHVNYFTPATLRRFVAGRFEIIDFKSTHFNPLVILKDLRGGAKEVPDEERVELLKRTTVYKQNPLLKPVKVLYRGVEQTLGALNLADNIVVVGRKKTNPS